MDKINQMKELVRSLNKASEAYYNSSDTIMSDFEYDHKLNVLKVLEDETGVSLSNSPTRNVGFTVLSDIPKVAHSTPMLSLDKCHAVEEIIKFANGHNLVSSIKLDGNSVRLVYENGELIQAESRGDGIEGNDITEHVKQFLNVPLHINKTEKYIIDGEALIKLDDFTEINKNGEYKNSRNLAAGTLTSLDTSVVKKRMMKWYAWEVVDGYDKIANSFYLNLIEAKSLGFDVVPFCDVTVDNFTKLQDIIDKTFKVADELHLPQDGVVFKFDDIKYGKSLGNTSHHFNNGIAFKIFNDSVETELIDIEWTMGKTGSLCPVAKFKPVEINETIVEKASLHNISVMREIMGDHPWVGQHIGVYKSNLIIPQIRWAEQINGDDRFEHIENKYLNIPIRCPYCGKQTKIVKENDSEVLMCTNPDCKGKLLGKLNHAVSRDALNIDGLSESTIEKFINLGWLNCLDDIYKLSNFRGLMLNLDGFGYKSVDKLLASIEKSRLTILDRFLNSLSVPLLGKSTSKLIAKQVNYDFGQFISVMTIYGAKYFSSAAGIGDVFIKQFDEYFKDNCHEIVNFSKNFVFKKENKINGTNSLKGKNFVITGSLNHFANRDAAKLKIEECGGKVSGSVTSKTDYLVCNENSNSGKSKKAKELGIPIITEDKLLKMIGE